MPNINTQLLDSSVAHQIYLERYSTSVARDMLKLLIKSEAAAKDLFDQRLSRIIELGFDSGPATSIRTEKLIQELGAAIEVLRKEQAFAPLMQQLELEFEKFSEYESGFIVNSSNQITTKALEGTGFQVLFNSVAAPQVWAAAKARPFSIKPGGSARTLGSYLSGMARAERVRVQDAVRVGVVNGETTQNIDRGVWGTIKNRQNTDGTASVIQTRKGAEALVRTAVNHISTVAKDQVYKENSDLMNGVVWQSTLDSRTTAVCIGRDGKKYPVNSGPRPPAHMNCRSVVVPQLKTYRELGINVDEPETSTRAYFAISEKMNVTQYRSKLRKKGLTKAQQDKIITSLSGQTDDPTYSAFLSRQSKQFQEKVLGIQRTELYRKGEIKLKDLISPKGTYYTLDELRVLQPDAFIKAGV